MWELTEEERLEKKRQREEQLKREESARRRRIIVQNISDLQEKYEEYDIKIDSFSKTVTLYKPLEVKYMNAYRHDCKVLGFNCRIEEHTVDMYRKYW